LSKAATGTINDMVMEAPTLLAASIATCTGIYIRGFLQARNLPNLCLAAYPDVRSNWLRTRCCRPLAPARYAIDLGSMFIAQLELRVARLARCDEHAAVVAAAHSVWPARHAARRSAGGCIRYA